MLRQLRQLSTKPSFFSLFPKTFPNGSNIPDHGFTLDTRQLKKEYRKLQAVSHPDLNNSLNESATTGEKDESSFINKAYETLFDPLKRAQYILQLQGLDVTDDAIGKKLQFQDKAMLIEMMEIHEQLEEIMDESDLESMKSQNNDKIKQLCVEISQDLQNKNWDEAATKTVRLKYCYNIKNALKEWQPGKPIILTH
ncbi:J-type chaperone [Martiniozyma asiatica (nom. inval.)]|nr:J-type chaperone [Martiniozyma asiatica]